jgi:hypothetical protein
LDSALELTEIAKLILKQVRFKSVPLKYLVNIFVETRRKRMRKEEL